MVRERCCLERDFSGSAAILLVPTPCALYALRATRVARRSRLVLRGANGAVQVGAGLGVELTRASSARWLENV